jgi:dCMP deaminase
MDHRQSAKRMSFRSPDPSTKVGCVIVDHARGSTIGVGWNDFPAGAPDWWWNVRERKYAAVVHAEVAALLSAGDEAKGALMYVTHHPCRDCAKHIAFAGIKTVVCPEGPWHDDPEILASVTDAANLLRACGVQVIYQEDVE